MGFEVNAQFTQEQISATDVVELISFQQLTTQLEVPPMEEEELPSFVCFTACVQQGLAGRTGPEVDCLLTIAQHTAAQPREVSAEASVQVSSERSRSMWFTLHQVHCCRLSNQWRLLADI